MDLELAGKVVLITGGTDGLGLALASQLTGEGASVAVCGRSEDRLESARTEIEAVGGDVLAVQADVSKAADLERFVDVSVARWGRIDAVVHNAGRASGGSIESIDDSTWEEDFQLKLMASVRLTRLALPHLRASRGSVLFTLAVSAKTPGAGSEPSSVNRAAGMALMKALSKELAPAGIRVNADSHRPRGERAVGPRRRRLGQEPGRVLRAVLSEMPPSHSVVSGAARNSPTSVASCSLLERRT